MHVSLIKIQNVLGISQLELVPKEKGITVISGRNEAGKTSVISAIKAALDGSHDATLLRHGSEKGEVVLVLDDGLELRKTITAEGSNLTVRAPNAGKLPSPKAFLDSILARSSFDPIAFLDAKPKDRLALLAQAAPVEMPKAELTEAVKSLDGVSQVELDRIFACHPLEAIRFIEKALYDERTRINRLQKDKEGTARDLMGVVTTDPRAEYTRLICDREKIQNACDGIQREQAKRLEAARQKSAEDMRESDGMFASEANGVALVLQSSVEKLKNDAEKSSADLRVEKARLEMLAAAAQKDIERIYSELQTALVREKDNADKSKADRERRHRESTARIEAKLKDEMDAICLQSANLAKEGQAKTLSINQEIDAKTKEIAYLDQAKKVLAESERLKERSSRFSETIESVRALYQRIASSIPIEGLEVVDGEVALNGTTFDRFSEAQRMDLSLEIARLLAQKTKLPLIVIDGLERLDPARLEIMHQRTEAWGLQVVATRVTEGDFQVGGVKEA